MSSYTYSQSEIDISIGIPFSILGLPAGIFITEFTEATIETFPQFNIKKGVFNEPYLEYINNTEATITIDVFHSSEVNEKLQLLLSAQKIGVAGFPLVIKHTKQGNDKLGRRSHVCPVSILTGFPACTYSKNSKVLRYVFKTYYIQNTYLL